MPISQGYKDIDTIWASDPTADRTAPDDPNLTPPIDPAVGFPASFSQASGDTPPRAVIQELYHRRDSALVDIRNHGVLPWDTDVDTLANGVKQAGGRLYRALVDNGPTYGNATDPTSTNTVWEVVSGTLSRPAAPDAPTATNPRQGELNWTWPCPLDGGAEVTSFEFQWREAGQTAWSTSIVTTTPAHVQTSLTNGTPIEARARAINSVGAGPWSSEGTATPMATVPGGGNTLALRADTGDASGEVDLDWIAPDDGGASISLYRYQWRNPSAGQLFSSSREGTANSLNAVVTGLTDGAEHAFQVRAENSVGNGAWSNESRATPEAPAAPTPQRVTVNIDQTYSWPFEGVERAVAVLRGEQANMVTVTLPSANTNVFVNRFNPQRSSITPYLSLGSALSIGGSTELFLGDLSLPTAAASDQRLYLRLARTAIEDPLLNGPDFSTQMEQFGTITMTASDGEQLVIQGITDAIEPYLWAPDNLAAVNTFATHVVGLTDRSLTVTFNDRSLTANPTTLQHGGTTYTNSGVEGGVAVAELTGLALNDQLVVDVEGGGRVDIYPQS